MFVLEGDIVVVSLFKILFVPRTTEKQINIRVRNLRGHGSLPSDEGQPLFPPADTDSLDYCGLHFTHGTKATDRACVCVLKSVSHNTGYSLDILS